MLYNLKSLKEAQVSGKTVLLRADLDVPIENSQILDDSRLNSWFPTLEYLLGNGAKIIIVGHLGRPNGADKNLTLLPVANWIATKLKAQIVEEKIGDFDGWKITDSVSLIENIRFYKEEEENDQEFARKLAQLGTIFVNDAFATAHRSHASTEGIAHFIPSYAGLRVLQEVEVLSRVLESPDRPLGVVIGGAKIETKLPLVEKMHSLADYVMVGGEIAENDKVLLKVQHEKVSDRKSVLLVADLNQSRQDITAKSAENFLQLLADAKTIVWNGPMGKIEDPDFQNGTLTLAEGIINIRAYSILGGGDTIGFLRSKTLLDKFSFVSVGGGAMLEFLSGDRLPGLTVLEQK